MTIFPSSLQPDWISDYVPSKPADVITDFDAGTTSRLRLTSVPSRASFRAEWNAIQGLPFRTLMEFWGQVGSTIAFELPANFFHCNFDVFNSLAIREGSSTGFWRLESMETSEDNSTLRSIAATFISEIDP